MSELRTTQIWGSLTKVVTLTLGVLQTVIILHILSPAQYGIIGIVTALASLVGVSQNVGVTDATIREIAMTDDVKHRAHIFWVSLWFRMLFTLPISLVLALFAGIISTLVYKLPDMQILIYIMSVVLILQGIQGVLGGVFSGLRVFGLLYVFQMITALLNILIFASFAYFYGVTGFFLAMVLSTIIFILMLAIYLPKAIGGRLDYPSKNDFIVVWKDIFHTGFWTYLARIFSVAWQQSPMLLLGKWTTPEVVGLYNVALSFGSKLTVLAAAIGEVNLAFLSNAFAKGKENFRSLAGKTLDEVGVVLLLSAGAMALLSDLLLKVFAGSAYAPALGVTVLVSWAYAFFAFLDISTNTVFVPSRRSQLRTFSFGVLIVVTLLTMFALRQNPLMAAGWGVLAGSTSAVILATFLSRKYCEVSIVPSKLIVAFLLSIILFAGSLVYPSLLLRVIMLVGVGAIIIWVALRQNIRVFMGRKGI
jgi:O-antigen/teichoic acid export membrane protein